MMTQVLCYTSDINQPHVGPTLLADRWDWHWIWKTDYPTIALKKKDDISKIDLVKLNSFNTYVQISCPSQ